MTASQSPQVVVFGYLMPSVLEKLSAVATLVKGDALDGLSPAERSGITCAVTTAVAGAPQRYLDQLPQLRQIVSAGAGRDKFDDGVLAARRIDLIDTGDLVSSDTADMAIALLYALARDVVKADAHVRTGAWGSAHFGARRRVAGRTAGIVGLGRIGRIIATRLSALGLRVLYTARSPKTAPWAYVDALETLAEKSDFLIVAMPGGPTTSKIINANILDALGPSGYLINVARGSLVDEDALVEALSNNRIAGAALDVYQSEPVPDPRLGALPNTILTPHIAAITDGYEAALGDQITRLVRAHFDPTAKEVMT